MDAMIRGIWIAIKPEVHPLGWPLIRYNVQASIELYRIPRIAATCTQQWYMTARLLPCRWLARPLDPHGTLIATTNQRIQNPTTEAKWSRNRPVNLYVNTLYMRIICSITSWGFDVMPSIFGIVTSRDPLVYVESWLQGVNRFPSADVPRGRLARSTLHATRVGSMNIIPTVR